MSPCECEWPGRCECQPEKLPVLTPAKACKIRLKTKGRGAPYQESATASESTPIKE